MEPGLPCRFNIMAAYSPQDNSSGPTVHPHGLAQTDVPRQEMRIYCPSAPWCSLQMYHLASIANLFKCTPTKASTHLQSQTKLLPHQTDRLFHHGVSHLFYLTQEAQESMASQLFEVLS